MSQNVEEILPQKETDKKMAFSWENYFEKTGCVPLENLAFSHVEISNRSYGEKLLKRDQIVKIPGPEEGDWKIRQIYTVCGNSVLLKKVNRSAGRPEVAEIGRLRLCYAEEMNLFKVNSENDSKVDVKQEEKSESSSTSGSSVNSSDELSTPSQEMLTLSPFNPNERIVCGQFLEVQHSSEPNKVYFGKIVQNRGGRLQIVGIGEKFNRTFWVYFLDEKLHQIGWCTETEGKEQGTVYGYEDNELEAFLTEAKANAVPRDVFEIPERTVVSQHQFRVGMKLEVLDPESQAEFLPGTVIKVINGYYFVVEIDRSVRSDAIKTEEQCSVTQMICHRGSHSIFPVYWCYRNGLRVSAPKGFPDAEFLWQTYRTMTGVSRSDDALDHLFDMGNERHNKYRRSREVEMLISQDSETFCAATVTRVQEHLVWIQQRHLSQATHSRIFDYRSMRLFPCGWSESNGFELFPPVDIERVMSPLPPESDYSSARTNIFTPVQCNYMPEHWRQNADKVRELPKRYGPGPMKLIFRILLNQLISCCRRPKDVLDILQPDHGGVSNKSRLIIYVKARYRRRGRRTRTYNGPIECCRNQEQFLDWACRLLSQLDACPNLFSTRRITAENPCDANCEHNLRPLAFLAPLKLSSSAVRSQALKRQMPRPRPRLRRPVAKDGLTGENGEWIKRARPVAVVEARRPVTRGVKLPKYSTMNSALHSPTKVAAKLVKKVTKVVQSKRQRSDVSKPLRIETDFGQNRLNRPVALISASQQSSKSPKLSQEIAKGRYPIPMVTSNPNTWTVGQLCAWLKNTDSYGITQKLADEEVDGQAFMLLTLKDCIDYLGIKLGPALKICGIIQELKLIFLNKYSEEP